MTFISSFSVYKFHIEGCIIESKIFWKKSYIKKIERRAMKIQQILPKLTNGK